ncbi:MAG: STAS domain-containing protein [Acidimicrobiia bacterium]|nr:STAS domain-containing protein [Acidimicrobiia bacterium]
MALELKQKEIEGIQILSLKGRLTVGPEATILRERLREMAEAGQVKVILDLKQVDYIDSTGLGGLVICFTTLRKAGGALKLLSLNKRNIELLLLTKLTTVFELFADEQDAVNSFFPGREISKFDILSFIESGGRER